MAESKCGNCDKYLGNNVICSSPAQIRGVMYSSPICIDYSPKKESVNQTEWLRGPATQTLLWKNEQLSTRWVH